MFVNDKLDFCVYIICRLKRTHMKTCEQSENTGGYQGPMRVDLKSRANMKVMDF